MTVKSARRGGSASLTQRKGAAATGTTPVVCGAFTFRHGIQPWAGITYKSGSVIDKVMFPTTAAAEAHVKRLGVVDPISWSESSNDLYLHYRKP